MPFQLSMLRAKLIYINDDFMSDGVTLLLSKESEIFEMASTDTEAPSAATSFSMKWLVAWLRLYAG